MLQIRFVELDNKGLATFSYYFHFDHTEDVDSFEIWLRMEDKSYRNVVNVLAENENNLTLDYTGSFTLPFYIDEDHNNLFRLFINKKGLKLKCVGKVIV